MRIKRGSRTAAVVMLLAATPSLAQTSRLCGRDIKDAFDRLGTPAMHFNDWDDLASGSLDWTPEARFRDFPRAEFDGSVRALVTSSRLKLVIEARGSFADLRQRLEGEVSGIVCDSRTVTWPPEPVLNEEDDPYGPDTPSFPRRRPRSPARSSSVAASGRRRPRRGRGWCRCASTKATATRCVILRGFPDATDWPERTIAVECVHVGALDHGWGWRWRNDGWPRGPSDARRGATAKLRATHAEGS